MEYTNEEKRVMILLKMMIASTYNTTYSAFEITREPASGKFIKHELKALFNQMRVVNDRLEAGMQKYLSSEEAESTNELANHLMDAGFCLIAVPEEVRKKLIEDMVTSVEEYAAQESAKKRQQSIAA